MKKKKYNLIYSRKHILKKNSTNLLVGKWINPNLFEKKNSNIEFFDYGWNNKKRQLKNFIKTKEIYIKVIKKISKILNSFHSKNYNLRQWEILIFFFLYHYIPIVYDRWNLIKLIKKKYKLEKVKLIDYDEKNFICAKSTDIFDLIRSHEWNDWIFSEIIKEQNIKSINFKNKKLKKLNIFKKKFEKQKKKNLFQYKKNENKFLITNLEMPIYQKMKLNFLLNQWNFFYSDSIVNFKIKKRNEKFFQLKNLKSNNSFFNFILKNLLKIFPQNFIENFKHLEKKLESLNWPKNPKIILTSYSHYNDDVFKIYAAQNIKKNAKIVVLQHGHQGHHKFCGTFYEKRICDKYITWGNSSKDKKIVPLFVTTNIGKKITKKNPKEILIKVTEFQLIPLKSAIVPWEIESITNYRNNLNIFLQYLDSRIKKSTTIKIFDNKNVNFISKKIKKNFDEIKIKKISRLFNRGYEDAHNKKLVIETLNSTGFLEMLSLNSPVILLTSKSLFFIKDEYKKFYNVLIKSKIIFFNAKEAAIHINNNLANIDKWWFQKERQKNIKYFCQNMCKYEKNNIGALSDILKKIAN